MPLFRDLTKKALARLEKIARERSFAADDVIVREGDEGVGFFLITSGQVAVTRDHAVLSQLSAGDFFGGMASLDNFRRSATAQPLAPAKALVMLRSDFITELRAKAGLAVEVLAHD